MQAGATAGSSAVVYESAGRTTAGRVRDHNEDAILDRPDLGLWVVADGMGGHSAGDVASQLIVSELDRLEAQPGLTPMCEAVEARVLEVNEELRRRSQGDAQRLMGSTVIFLIAREGFVLCGWAGDSRAYRLRNNTLTQVSRDHSHVQELIARGEITSAEAREHPNANVVTRAVGGEDRLVLEYMVEEARVGDRFLLCSDGVDKELEDEQIRDLLNGGDGPQACVDRLIEAAEEAGGHDNVSCVVIEVRAGDGH